VDNRDCATGGVPRLLGTRTIFILRIFGLGNVSSSLPCSTDSISLSSRRSSPKFKICPASAVSASIRLKHISLSSPYFPSLTSSNNLLLKTENSSTEATLFKKSSRSCSSHQKSKFRTSIKLIESWSVTSFLNGPGKR